MRKLASIRKVSEIIPIKDADAIEAIRIDGWWVVSKKGEFNVGDLCVYFEIDSFLPVEPMYEFLRKSCFKSTKHLGDGFRLKTIKLRGQVFQGLALPLNIVFGKDFVNAIGPMPIEGEDVTDILGVRKWEDPIPAQLSGTAKGNFPSFIQKTDKERIQNIYGKLGQTHLDTIFIGTLKLDGSSMTVYHSNEKFGVCSRNLDLKETDDNTFWKVSRKYNMEEILKVYGKNIAIQGELMGPGIQGNREKLSDHDFYVFNIWDIDNRKYLSPKDESQVCSELSKLGCDLKVVPNVYEGKVLEHSLDVILDMSDIKSINNNVAEGVVYKSTDGQTTFKVINTKFLLKEE